MKTKEELNALKEEAETRSEELRKLFIRQLMQLFIQGFDFLFQGV